MRLLIAGGGTGGHLYPGVAVAQELLARPGQHRVLFAGTRRGIEARVLPALGLPFEPVRAAGVVGRGPAGALRGAAVTLAGLGDAWRVVRRFRPHACLGVGGYASVAVVAVARLLGVPTAVQEQNAWPGLANRVLGRWVHRVYAGFPEAAGRFPRGRTLVTGNPVRAELARPAPFQAPGPGRPAHLLVIGGSQGARVLNETVPPALERVAVPVEVLHQAGPGRADETRERYGARQGVRVAGYLEDMASAYAWAHLVVARAGALTVAELAAAGRPAVLVPYPHAAGAHQEHNARSVEARGAGVCLPQAGLTPERLAAVLGELLGSPGRLEAMAEAAAASARRDAARVIVDDLMGRGWEAGRLGS